MDEQVSFLGLELIITTESDMGKAEKLAQIILKKRLAACVGLQNHRRQIETTSRSDS